MQFFPDVGPDRKPADRYFRESLDLLRRKVIPRLI